MTKKSMYGRHVFFRRKMLPSLFVVLFLVILFCSKAGAILLLNMLQYGASPDAFRDNKLAQAIVVLGNARNRDERAAQLHWETGLPILVTGGPKDGTFKSEAARMVHILQDDLATPVAWAEDKSRNTEENAKFSAPILRSHGIQRILLVTDARHMLRARLIFLGAGFDVVPAPVKFVNTAPLSLSDFLPSSSGWRFTKYVLHEVGGIGWYFLRWPVKRPSIGTSRLTSVPH